MKRAQELTGGFGADYAFDAIGGEKTAVLVRRRHRAWRPRRAGRHPGVLGHARRSRRSGMVYGEKKITGTYYGSIRPAIDFGVLADLDMDKRIDLDSLISRTYKFDEINEGFRLMTDGRAWRAASSCSETRNVRRAIAKRIAPMQRQIGAIRLAPIAPYRSMQ